MSRNVVTCWMGISPAFAPRRILSMVLSHQTEGFNEVETVRCEAALVGEV